MDHSTDLNETQSLSLHLQLIIGVKQDGGDNYVTLASTKILGYLCCNYFYMYVIDKVVSLLVNYVSVLWHSQPHFRKHDK